MKCPLCKTSLDIPYCHWCDKDLVDNGVICYLKQEEDFDISKRNKLILDLIDKGYYVNKEGVLFSRHRKLRVQVSNKNKRATSYYYAMFTNKGVKRSMQVHRIQGYHKFGSKMFEEGKLIRHLNNNSLDNSWGNIGIGTAYDNYWDNSKETRNRFNGIRK